MVTKFLRGVKSEMKEEDFVLWQPKYYLLSKESNLSCIWVQYHYIQLTLKDGILALEKIKVC